MEGVGAGSARGVRGEKAYVCSYVVARKGIDRWNRCQAGGLIVSPVGVGEASDQGHGER